MNIFWVVAGWPGAVETISYFTDAMLLLNPRMSAIFCPPVLPEVVGAAVVVAGLVVVAVAFVVGAVVVVVAGVVVALELEGVIV
jgi:hypothetical protein